MNRTEHNDTGAVKMDIIFSTKLIVSICYAIIEIFGLCGNILVILTVCSGWRRLQTNYYRLVFHLAICDIFLLLAGNLLFTLGPWLENQYWPSNLGTITCIIIFPLVGCIFTTELALLVVIAILRHKAVTQPLRPRISRKKLQYIIALVHIVPLFLNIPTFLSQQVTRELCTTRWKDNMYYYVYTWILDLAITLLPMLFLVVLYTKMCYSLALHQKNLKTLFSPEATSLTNDQQDRRTKSHYYFRTEKNAKMIIISVIVVAQFFTAVLPIRVLGKLVAHGREEDQFHLVWMMPLYFLVSCSFNPIVYGFGDKTIRDGYKLALNKIFSCK